MQLKLHSFVLPNHFESRGNLQTSRDLSIQKQKRQSRQWVKFQKHSENISRKVAKQYRWNFKELENKLSSKRVDDRASFQRTADTNI